MMLKQWDTEYHAPALVGDVIELLGGGTLVLDGTLGGGGHSAALLDAGVSRVIGIDRDPDALQAARARFAHEAPERFARRTKATMLISTSSLPSPT